MESNENNDDNSTANNKKDLGIDNKEYREDPEKLFGLAHQFFNKKQFEEGLSLIEKGIEYAVEKYGSEARIEVAKFYDEYAEGLIRKQMESDEILAIPQAKFEGEPNESKVNNNQGKEHNDEQEDEENGEDADDEQISYENLMVANTLYLNYLKDYDLKSPSELSKDTIKYYLQLADNYFLFGELELVKSNFAEAYTYYTKAIDLRKRYDDKFSRSLAECYFKCASVLDYDMKKCLLSYYKTKVIMEYHLKKKVEEVQPKEKIAIVIDENDLDLLEINEHSEKIYLNKGEIDSETMKTVARNNEAIGNFVDIINELYQKIEDLILEIREYDKFMTEKKTLKAQNEFTDNYDKDKVLDISNTLVKKKRPRSPLKDDLPEDESSVKVKKLNSEHK